MAHLLRGKQSGIALDLSAGISPDLFTIDDLTRYGINSQVSCLAYDPVQSLLAVGTKNTQFGPGQIYVFGQKRVQVVLPLPARGASVKTLQFCADKLICLDSKHDISVHSLGLKRLLSSHTPPGHVTTLCSDPLLDYALLGMQTGDILAYDLDRESLAPFKIPNLWMEVDSKARVSPVIALQFHPRDIGSLLIGYMHGAVIYDFKLNKARRFYQYEIPRGAPGGDGDPMSSNVARRPKLTQAVWHPTGTFVMTGHEDSSIVFWDTVKDGRMLMARTLTDTHVASPGTIIGNVGQSAGTLAVKEPLFRVAWCANADPEDTAILIAGGQSTQSPTKGLTLFEMGRTPVYATSSWDVLMQYFDSPKRQRILPTPPGAEVVDFCLLPRASPHFAGAHDPLAVIALLSSGELLTLTFPSGVPISPTNQLHLSLTFVHPFIKSLSIAQVDRERWLGMTERRQQGPPLLKGGAEAVHAMRRFEGRSIAQTVHADGTLRLWDVGHGDEIENDKVLQVDVGRAVGRLEGVDITHTSLAGASGELAAGLRSGEVAIFRWSTNRNSGREASVSRSNQPGKLTSITDRADPGLSEGLLPFTILDQRDGPVTAIRMSEVGFIAAGFEGGSIAVIDLRGPAIIFSAPIHDFSRGHSKGTLRRRASSAANAKPEWATQIQFSVLTLENEDYSSILLHVGTNLGHLATFKILPDPSGRYTVQYAGSLALDSRIIHIAPLNTDTGKAAAATQSALGSLQTGHKTPGALLIVTATGIHISRPPSSKGAHKSFDTFFCDAAAVVRYQDLGHCLVGLFGDGYARAYSIPALREIASANLGGRGWDVRRFGDAAITPTGHVMGFTGPSELALANLWGIGEPAQGNADTLFNPLLTVPPRPTISNLQWVTGTQYITPSDMDILIGGPSRPPSKRMIAQSRSETEAQRTAARSSVQQGQQGQEGYWEYMQRQIQERTEKLGLVGEGVERVEQNSASWADEAGKFVSRQKRGIATSMIKAKFGL